MTSDFIKKIIIISVAVLLGGAGLVTAFTGPTADPPNGEKTFWRLNGTSIYYDVGSVGIGTSSPSSKLVINGGDVYASGYVRGGTQICIGASCRTLWGDAVQGAISFFNLSSCPTGWSELTSARGRYLVGLPSGGTLAGTAGTALSNQENRAIGQHTHDVNDPNHRHNTDGALVGPFPEITYQFGSGNKHFTFGYTGYSYSGVTVNATGTVAGTNASYIQLLVCQKS